MLSLQMFDLSVYSTDKEKTSEMLNFFDSSQLAVVSLFY